MSISCAIVNIGAAVTKGRRSAVYAMLGEKGEKTMNQGICNAIRNRNLLNFSYDGYLRVVEPHAHGISTAGHEVIRCYQVRGSGSDGKSTGWHLMTVSKIVGLKAMEETFSKPRDGYRKGGKGMSTIFCEL
jgi:hypothetical protein